MANNLYPCYTIISMIWKYVSSPLVFLGGVVVVLSREIPSLNKQKKVKHLSYHISYLNFITHLMALLLS